MKKLMKRKEGIVRFIYKNGEKNSYRPPDTDDVIASCKSERDTFIGDLKCEIDGRFNSITIFNHENKIFKDKFDKAGLTLDEDLQHELMLRSDFKQAYEDLQNYNMPMTDDENFNFVKSMKGIDKKLAYTENKNVNFYRDLLNEMKSLMNNQNPEYLKEKEYGRNPVFKMKVDLEKKGFKINLQTLSNISNAIHGNSSLKLVGDKLIFKNPTFREIGVDSNESGAGGGSGHYELDREKVSEIDLNNPNWETKLEEALSYFTPPSTGCFIAGTQITMEDGSTKNIEDIKVGEIVTAFNEKDGKNEKAKVLGIESPVVDSIYILNQGLLTTTEDHPLFVTKSDGTIGWASFNPEKSLKVTSDLDEMLLIEIGDSVQNIDGDKIKITNIELKEETTQTYNLKSIENLHTFYADGILAHNKGGGDGSGGGFY